MRLDAGGLSEGESVDGPHAGETKFERAHIWASQTPNALDVKGGGKVALHAQNGLRAELASTRSVLFVPRDHESAPVSRHK
jgi:hypothetical protein